MNWQVYDQAAVAALCEALGQDPRDVTRIVIDIRAGEVPQVHLTRLATGSEVPTAQLVAGLQVHCDWPATPPGCAHCGCRDVPCPNCLRAAREQPRVSPAVNRGAVEAALLAEPGRGQRTVPSAEVSPRCTCEME